MREYAREKISRHAVGTLMRRKSAVLEIRDALVLAVARSHIAARGPLGDEQLVELLEALHVAGRATVARESLFRLERAGHLSFGPSGWQEPPAAPALLLSPVPYPW